jgi:NAD-dependent SIR2 family protein deacetylase
LRAESLSNAPSLTHQPVYVIGDHSITSPMKILGNTDPELCRMVQGRGRDIISKFGGTAIFSVVESIRRHMVACLRPQSTPSPLTMGVYLTDTSCKDSGCFMSVPARVIDGKFTIDPEVFEEHRDTISQYMDKLVGISPSSNGNGASDPTVPLNSIIQCRLNQVRNVLMEASAVYLLIGAGLSVDCGIPHIQGKFSETFPSLPSQGIDSIFDISNIAAFTNHPELAWGFFGTRALCYMRAKPSDSYLHLREMLNRQGGQTTPYFIETTNIDNLLVVSELFSPDSIYERHGTVFDVQCTSPHCSSTTRRETEDYFCQLNIDPITTKASHLPLCSKCQSIERPATVLAVEHNIRLHQNSIEQKKLRKLFVHQHLQHEPSHVVIIEIGVGTQTSKLRHRSATMVKERRGRYQQSGPQTHFIRVNPVAYHISTTDYPGSSELGLNISLPMTAHNFLSQI